MARKTTTKAFREHAVSMVIAGKSTEQVATELQVEHEKVRRWFNKAVSTYASINPGIFDALSSAGSQSKNEALQGYLWVISGSGSLPSA